MDAHPGELQGCGEENCHLVNPNSQEPNSQSFRVPGSGFLWELGVGIWELTFFTPYNSPAMTQSIARVVVTSVVVLGFASLVRAQAPDGAELYKRTCAQCHDTGANRAPARDAFQSMPAERVMAAMETGSMITMAIGRTADERKAIAEFLTGKSLSNPVVLAPAPAAMCPAGSPAFDSTTGPRWTGWGQNTNNTRFQDAGAAGLTAADIPKLKLKWAFAFPGDLQSYSQASIVGGRIFVGSWGGTCIAQRRDRMHSLVLQHRTRRAIGCIGRASGHAWRRP